MSKLDELRKKYKRKDLLFIGMGMETVEVSEEQKKEDLTTYKFIKAIRGGLYILGK